MSDLSHRQLLRRLAIWGCGVIATVLLAACAPGSSFGSAEALAMAYVKAIYVEHNPQKAVDMACTGTYIRRNFGISGDWVTRWAEESQGWEVKQFSVDKSSAFAKVRATPLTAADKANGITGRTAFDIHLLKRDSSEAQWEDYSMLVPLEKINNVWCVID